MLVEKNIPIPPSTSDVVKKMEAGDSVIFETEQEALRFRDHMRYRRIRYTMRKSREGYRVWRLT